MQSFDIGDEEPLEITQKLSNGAIVVDYRWRKHQGGEEPGKHGVVLAILSPHEAVQNYVTWLFVRKLSDESILTVSGDYYDNLHGAIKSFERRCKLMINQEVQIGSQA